MATLPKVDRIARQNAASPTWSGAKLPPKTRRSCRPFRRSSRPPSRYARHHLARQPTARSTSTADSISASRPRLTSRPRSTGSSTAASPSPTVSATLPPGRSTTSLICSALQSFSRTRCSRPRICGTAANRASRSRSSPRHSTSDKRQRHGMARQGSARLRCSTRPCPACQRRPTSRARTSTKTTSPRSTYPVNGTPTLSPTSCQNQLTAVERVASASPSALSSNSNGPRGGASRVPCRRHYAGSHPSIRRTTFCCRLGYGISGYTTRLLSHGRCRRWLHRLTRTPARQRRITSTRRSHATFSLTFPPRHHQNKNEDGLQLSIMRRRNFSGVVPSTPFSLLDTRYTPRPTRLHLPQLRRAPGL